jgi:predicted  nucleic acid-binding Zn-ribbon protein
MGSLPVKIPPELYQRLKQRAKEEGMTLQQALVDLLLDSHTEVSQLKRQLENLGDQIGRLKELRNKDTEALNSWAGSWKEISNLATELKSLNKRLERLEQDIPRLEKQVSEVQSHQKLKQFLKR